MTDYVAQYFERHLRVMEKVSSELSAEVEQGVSLIVKALQGGKKILVMGNGGSAADAQHLAAEFVGRFLLERRALPAIALTTDTSILTAVGNDYGYEDVFKRQVEALAGEGDIVIGISTSGNSNNIFHALTAANEKGAKTIGLLGCDGGSIAGIVDLALVVSVDDTPHIQEAHITLIHLLCDLVERQLYGAKAEA
ncbi:MAG: D-sedoheptulose 7-phosphate isomerase [Desulfuromonadales bacterium]|nr:D-sedoheptulose 7-phosphate isomerase [Desulfuromonadales bacterium]NIS39830.1 D-sedoheptulose 7-phosphate isomerase [Desulfuromonadales bacterium]